MNFMASTLATWGRFCLEGVMHSPSLPTTHFIWHSQAHIRMGVCICLLWPWPFYISLLHLISVHSDPTVFWFRTVKIGIGCGLVPNRTPCPVPPNLFYKSRTGFSKVGPEGLDPCQILVYPHLDKCWYPKNLAWIRPSGTDFGEPCSWRCCA